MNDPLLLCKTKIIGGDLYKFFVDTHNYIHECYRYDDCKSSLCEQLNSDELPRAVADYAEDNMAGWYEDLPRQETNP